MENKKKTGFNRIGFALIVLFMALAIIYVFGFSWRKKPAAQRNGYEMLTNWTQGCEAKKELISYVEAVTDEKGEDYIPEENRIAVFDFDGTLFCETDPVSFARLLLEQRVMEDPEYMEEASEFEQNTAYKISMNSGSGASFADLDTETSRALALAFAGMTSQEVCDYIRSFGQQPMTGYNGMNRAEAWYKPMLQAVDYLNENGFTVYIVSETDRFVVRALVKDSPLNVPMNRIIGSDVSLAASGQGDKDGADYTFTGDDLLVTGNELIWENVKMNKVAAIGREIGLQPVLFFGNSESDSSAATYVTNGNPYKSLAFMVCCDDVKRENGNPEEAEKTAALCEENEWIPISMKDDWKTIYGSSVKKK